MEDNKHVCDATNVAIDDIIAPETPPITPNQVYIDIKVHSDSNKQDDEYVSQCAVDDHENNDVLPESNIRHHHESMQFFPIFPTNTVSKQEAITNILKFANADESTGRITVVGDKK